MQFRITPKLQIFAAGLSVFASLAVPAVASSNNDFGCSVRHNVETQVVDMDPRYVGDLVEGGVGKRSTAAVNRYMTDKIRPLIRSDLRSAVGLQGGAAKSGDVSSSGDGK